MEPGRGRASGPAPDGREATLDGGDRRRRDDLQLGAVGRDHVRSTAARKPRASLS
jgi:hypothetical protein